MLPYFQTQDRMLSMLQTQWGSQLNPVLQNPLLNGRLMLGVSLSAGTNVINHLLGRKLISYILCAQNAVSDIYQEPSMDANLYLNLNASADVTVDLYVF